MTRSDPTAWLALGLWLCACGQPTPATQRLGSDPGSALVDPLPSIAVSLSAVCTAREGRLWCWGTRSVGWPVDGWASPAPVHGPTPLDLADGVRSVAAGQLLTCGVTGAGRVRCWGSNIRGGMGSGRCGRFDEGWDRYARLPARALRVAVHSERACAILEDRTVTCWGGVGTGYTEQCRPGPALREDGSRLDHIVEIAVDAAVDEDGTLWLWGSDRHGERRRDADEDRELAWTMTARPMRDLGEVRAIARVDGTVCVLGVDGQTRCWGNAANDLLGIAGTASGGHVTTASSPGPHPVARSLACGSESCCVVTSAGEAWCWGAFARSLGAAEGRDGAAPRRLFEGPVATLGIGDQVICAVLDRPDHPVECLGYGAMRLGRGERDPDFVAREPVRVAIPDAP